MTQIIQLSGKYSCQECGNEVKVSDLKCWHCRKEFSGKIKTFNLTPKPTAKPYDAEKRRLTREDIVRMKVRRNVPLVIEDFVSIRKLLLLQKGEKIRILM